MPIFKPGSSFLGARAIAAAILVAVIVTLSYWSVLRGIQREHDDLQVVSLAQQQTAEIATTLYLANLTAYAPDHAHRDAYRALLDQAVQRLEDRHHIFSLEKPLPNIPAELEVVLRKVYIGERHIDEQMEAFLREAQHALESGGEVADLNDLAKQYTTLVPAHVRLNDWLRAEARAAYNRLTLQAHLDWLVALAGLGAVVLLIVRPTARRTEEVMKELWRARAKATEKAAAADAARRAQANFIRTMNHELRTPLNAILGMAQLMRMQDLSPKQDDYMCDIQQAGEHLLGLINQVLDLARLDAKQVTISKDPAMLEELLDRATNMLRPLAAQKSLDLRYRCADELSGQYLADGAHIQQVLVNLIGNAVKFTEEGWIEVRAVPAGPEEAGITEVRFEVEDTGIGVPHDHHEAIFEEFQQADDMLAQDHGGTGLGLAISRALVHLMGGQMGLESERKKGSLFWFVLPLERAGADANA